jgi:hypothetical protein
MTWIVYQIPPTDKWWEFLPTVTDVAVGMASDGALYGAEGPSVRKSTLRDRISPG